MNPVATATCKTPISKSNHWELKVLKCSHGENVTYFCYLHLYKACFPLNIMEKLENRKKWVCSVQKRENGGVPWRSSGTLRAATGGKAITWCLTLLQVKKERADNSAREGRMDSETGPAGPWTFRAGDIAIMALKLSPSSPVRGELAGRSNICVVGSGSEPSTRDKSSIDKSSELLENFLDSSGRPWDLHLWRAARGSQAINTMPCLSCEKYSLRPGGWTLKFGDVFQPCEPLSPLKIPVPAWALSARH